MLKHVRCHFKLIFDISWLFHGFYGLRKVVEIYKQKKCCLSSTMWTLKSRKCENRFIYSISKNDAYGLWCGLWWDSVTLGEFTQGMQTHSKTCKPRMSGILFSFGNSQFKICFIFMLILLLNIRLAVRHLWSPKMLG